MTGVSGNSCATCASGTGSCSTGSITPLRARDATSTGLVTSSARCTVRVTAALASASSTNTTVPPSTATTASSGAAGLGTPKTVAAAIAPSST